MTNYLILTINRLIAKINGSQKHMKGKVYDRFNGTDAEVKSRPNIKHQTATEKR